jgi:hypothetical protein
MRGGVLPAAWLVTALLGAACSLEPSGKRPGLWISGEIARDPVSDWSFTSGVEEILIETRSGYGLPHSVTIWCVSLDGELYVGASAPDFPQRRRWVRNVRRDPDVRLGIAGRIYERRLEPVADPVLADSVNRAFGRKYRYDVDADPDPVFYWRVVERERDARPSGSRQRSRAPGSTRADWVEPGVRAPARGDPLRAQ